MRFQAPRLAICTLTIGNQAEQFAKYSHPAFQKYAKKIRADFIVFNKSKVNYGSCKYINPLKFEKYQIFDVLENYDRVAFFDTDILITPHAPSIFDEVSEDQIGGVYEDFAGVKEHRRSLIQKVQEKLGDVGWETGFMNSGVFVVSKKHREVFQYIWKYGVFEDPETKYEQTNTNWYFHKAGFQIKNIDYRWNFMGMMRIYYGPFQHDAYAIHYAGGGIFSGMDKIEQIKNDYTQLYGNLSKN